MSSDEWVPSVRIDMTPHKAEIAGAPRATPMLSLESRQRVMQEWVTATGRTELTGPEILLSTLVESAVFKETRDGARGGASQFHEWMARDSARFEAEVAARITAEDQRDAARSAIRVLLEIGKRDLSNPKYDGYFKALTDALGDPT